MSYREANDLYWTLAVLIAAGTVVVAGLGTAILWLRHRRFVRARDAYLGRVEKRQSRAFEDTCWFLLREGDARIAETIADTKAVVRVLADVRRTRVEAV